MKNILLAFSLIITSCTSYLDRPPTYAIAAEALERTSYGITRIGVYNRHRGFFNIFLPETSSDNMISSSGASDYDLNRIPATGANWNNHYLRIVTCNSFIAQLNKEGNKTDMVSGLTINEYLSEARFLRAYTYYQLIVHWGDVPYVDENTSFFEASTMARTPVDEIIPKIFEDLKFTQEYGRPYSVSGHYYVSKEAATALLARLYWYTDDLANARTEAEKIITSPNMGITNNYQGIWKLQNFKEVIMAIGGLPDSNNGMGWETLHQTAGGRFNHAVERSLVNDFAKEPTDSRRAVIVDIPGLTENPDVAYYTVKYPPNTEADFWPITRVAEMYLISAEAQGYPSGLARLNQLRVARNVPELTTATITNATQFYEAVMRERRLELCFEGFRWVDLSVICRRYNLNITQYLPNIKDINDYNLWYPVLQSEIMINPNLKQNQGYGN